MPRSDDTIVLPQQATRADGVDPDAAMGRSGERAIFSHPGPVKTLQSGRWVAAIDVVLAKIIAVAVTFNDACSLLVMKNNDTVASLAITGLNQQMNLDPVPLTAESDLLWVQVSAAEGAVEDLTVFISFVAPPL